MSDFETHPAGTARRLASLEADYAVILQRWREEQAHRLRLEDELLSSQRQMEILAWTYTKTISRVRRLLDQATVGK